MPEESAPALKEIFNTERFRHIAAELKSIAPELDTKRFLKLALADLESLTLMQRLRRMTECLHAILPPDYSNALATLRELAPRINHNFVTLALPDFVGRYGHEKGHFEPSMEALAYFTTFGSAEFAIREFLKRDLKRTLKVMQKWSLSNNEHHRRLASEGCRPRLPWSFRLEALIEDPSLALPILENLRNDPSLYVRKSVANHLNDITKDHPSLVLDLLETWPLEQKNTAWIARHALRTLIKKGDRLALAIIGAGERPKVILHNMRIAPRDIVLGNDISLTFSLESTAKKPQRLVVDYRIHYVKKSGGTSGKVFKLKELTLKPGETVSLGRKQSIRDFTTRIHHPGRHEVDILVNGEVLGTEFFNLK